MLAVTDQFTKYGQAYPTKNKPAKIATDKINNYFFLCFGIPEKMLPDQEGEFQNNFFKHLSRLCRVKQLCTTPYHPQANGQTEEYIPPYTQC